MEAKKEIVIRTENDLKVVLATQYMRQINNYFGDEKKALSFLSAVVAATQRLPQLLECTPITVINSFMVMAQLGFMPSAVSGEAYVLPYKNKGVLEAQFQIGYQGIVTLLYAAGNREVIAEMVYEKDKFAISRGKITHEVDPRLSKDERGEWIGTYAIIVTATGGTLEGYMTKKDVLKHAKKFSKSFNSEYSPWNEKNDPEGWMPRKTVLKQVAKLAPKNEKLNLAIAEDNKDSIIADRLDAAKEESKDLSMGNLLKNHEKGNTKKGEEGEADQGREGQDQADAPEGMA